jgi:hypothetical protein
MNGVKMRGERLWPAHSLLLYRFLRGRRVAAMEGVPLCFKAIEDCSSTMVD